MPNIIEKSNDTCKSISDNYASSVEKELESICNCQNEVILRMHSLEIEHVYDKQMEQILAILRNCKSQLREELIKVKEAQLTLVKKIKFFHELGNCQFKESLQIIDIVKKLDKDIQKMESTSSKNAENLYEKYCRLMNVQKSKLLQVYVGIARQMNRRNNNFVYLFQPICLFSSASSSKEEFDFNNDVVSKIKELQASIKREVYNIKFEIKKSKAFFQDFKNHVNQHLGDFDYVDYTIKLGIEALDVLKTTGYALMFPNNLKAGMYFGMIISTFGTPN